MESPFNTIQLILGISVAALTYHFIIRPGFISPLSKIPAAHWSCHISPVWLWWMRFYGYENRRTYQSHIRCGPIVRIAPDQLSLNCFEGGLKQIYLGNYPRSEFYARGFTKYGKDNIFTMRSTAAHAVRKKLFSSFFTKSYVLASASVRAVNQVVVVERLLPVIQDKVDEKEPVDVLELGYAYSMDSFVNWQFGTVNGCNLLQNEKEKRIYLDGFFGAAPYMFMETEMPRLSGFLQKIGLRLAPQSVEAGLVEIEDWNIDMCDKAARAIYDDCKPALVDEPLIFEQALRTMGTTTDGVSGTAPLTDYHQRLEIASEMYTFNSAAHETSGNTLAYLFYELSRRVTIQERLRAELTNIDHPIAFPHTNNTNLPSPKEIDALPFLDAVITETLRLYPSVPGPQPRVAPEKVSLGGINNIPAGTIVQCNAYTLHRNAEVFPDPEEWDPERWIQASPMQLQAMRRWFWAFGSGASMCLGLHFAMMSMKIATAAIYSNYRTSVHEVGDMELGDAYIAGPSGRKLCRISNTRLDTEEIQHRWRQ